MSCLSCEWNPEFERGSGTGDDPGACTNPATVNVGADGKWHLCESCAGLPAFARLGKKPLPVPDFPRGESEPLRGVSFWPKWPKRR